MGNPKTTVSIDLLRLLFAYSSRIGIYITEIVSELAIPFDNNTSSKTVRISIEKFNKIWQKVAMEANDDNFGLHFAEASVKFSHRNNILFSVMINSLTVEQALEKLIRYHDIMTDFVKVRLDKQDKYACLRLEPELPSTMSMDRHHVEAVMASLVFTLRSLTEGCIQFTEVRFEHAKPLNSQDHQRIFASLVLFGQSRNEIYFRPEDLKQPIPMADPELLEVLESFTGQLLERIYSTHIWSNQVIHLMSKMLSQGEKPVLEKIAGTLIISARHLQNKLKAEGTNFQTLLDQLRQEIATDYLKNREIDLCDLTFLLGFSEQSTFNHAFKRWTGSNPKEYQNLHINDK